MKFIQGINRNQTYLFPVSLDESIDQDNVVRAVDAFVESLPLKMIGFKVDFVENGRPAYHPKDLLKLFIYGYLNKTRSSRDLEKECNRNIEVMWLVIPEHIDPFLHANDLSNTGNTPFNGITHYNLWCEIIYMSLSTPSISTEPTTSPTM